MRTSSLKNYFPERMVLTTYFCLTWTTSWYKCKLNSQITLKSNLWENRPREEISTFLKSAPQLGLMKKSLQFSWLELPIQENWFLHQSICIRPSSFYNRVLLTKILPYRKSSRIASSTSFLLWMSMDWLLSKKTGTKTIQSHQSEKIETLLLNKQHKDFLSLSFKRNLNQSKELISIEISQSTSQIHLVHQVSSEALRTIT